MTHASQYGRVVAASVHLHCTYALHLFQAFSSLKSSTLINFHSGEGLLEFSDVDETEVSVFDQYIASGF